MPDPQDVRGIYEMWHSRFGTDPNADSPWYRLVRAHLDTCRDISGKSVLEIGCGRGDFVCWLGRQPANPARIVGADFSTSAVQKGRSFALEHGLKIHWEVSDIQAIAHADATFDTVISCETVEHVSHPLKAIRELARVLRPAGRLFLTTPNYLCLTGLYRGYLRLLGRRYTEMGQPINNFTVLPLTCAWIKRAGLRILSVDAKGHYVPFPGRPPIALRKLDQLRFVMGWFGLHSLILAEKT